MKNDEDENGKFPLHSSTPLKIIRDLGELFEDGFEVVDAVYGLAVGTGSGSFRAKRVEGRQLPGRRHRDLGDCRVCSSYRIGDRRCRCELARLMRTSPLIARPSPTHGACERSCQDYLETKARPQVVSINAGAPTRLPQARQRVQCRLALAPSVLRSATAPPPVATH
jgi:hypothetical protein